ncbi:hypothetical protein ACHAWO_000674 [Cyclotella atomus]|uniref:F-box domain-containing protein n=1 Tax=Cyclotella atomus TaxID=382360 RepID=A0ABD3NHS4_9STRA
MVKLRLQSPFKPANHGRRRSTRIQEQQQRQEAEREELERLQESMAEKVNNTSPGQRRSFDDINSSSNIRRILSGNKKTRRSTSAAGRNGVIRLAATMFRPPSRGPASTLVASSSTSFESLEVKDTSSGSFDVDMTTEPDTTVLSWMQTNAPPDVLPRILSFCGSRKVNALSRVNKTWNKLITTNELVWRVMCEDTHKWNEEDEVPASWIDHYKQNPCLPYDYDSIDAAFEAISSGPRMTTKEHQNDEFEYRHQTKSARIILKPGPYFLSRSLVCNVIGSAHITIECLVGSDPKHGMIWSRNFNKSSNQGRSAISMTSSILDVRKPSSAHLSEAFAAGLSSPIPQQNFNENSMSEIMNGVLNGSYPLHCVEGANPTAYLIFESRKDDVPCIRVRQGAVTIRGLKFLHYADGNDIWNGNTAIQVQGPFHGNRLLRIAAPSIQPTAHVIDCDIQSLSGRGIVSIDGGITRVDNCFIHNCAATGLYLGGGGSVATITRTDVYENGNGNERRRSMGDENVRRGHSGIYVEQGTARVRDCNISKNSLTGMSGISPDKATLQIENSDIISNGSVQLELPPRGTVSRDRSFSRGNNISAFRGMGRPRTRFLQELLKPRDEYSGPVGQVRSVVYFIHFARLSP